MIGDLRIAIIGAGIGGLTAAAALSRFGASVNIFEQADKFSRIGAGIQMSPNAMKVLYGLGLEKQICKVAFQPKTWNNRTWDTGEVKFELTLGSSAIEKYGAPYLQMHRGDLHSALLSVVPADIISMNKQLVDVVPRAVGFQLNFTDGTDFEADLVVGADGIHSRVREIIIDTEPPTATGRVAYRATFPVSRLRFPVGECTKWWGADRHIVIYYVTARKDEVYFVTSLPDEDWAHESYSATGDMNLVREAFADFHDDVNEVLRACSVVLRWAILEREPLRNWSRGNIVLIGDAAHPMTPYMAQGAAMAMEDGVILARAFQSEADIKAALAVFERTRRARTAQVQAVSHANTWMREETDPAWCYGFDPWTEPLAVKI